MSYSTTRSEAAYLAAQEVIAGGVNSGARGPGAGWVPGPPVAAAAPERISGTSTATSTSTTCWPSGR